jgi:hypothetical protein
VKIYHGASSLHEWNLEQQYIEWLTYFPLMATLVPHEEAVYRKEDSIQQ